MVCLAALAGGCGGVSSGAPDGMARTSSLTFDIDGLPRTATTAWSEGPDGNEEWLAVKIAGTADAFALNIYLFVPPPFQPGAYSCGSPNGSTLTYYDTPTGALYTSQLIPCTVTFTETATAMDGWMSGTFSSELQGNAMRQIANGAFDVKRRF